MIGKDMTKQVHYDQNVINDSLANTFEMEPMKNNQAETKLKVSKRGGARPGSGRKAGSTNKIQGVEFLEEYKKIHGTSLKEDLARDMHEARLRGDYDMLFKYQTAFAKYYFADVASQDITSKGEALGASFTFPTKELIDWNNA
jgi:hypothetical protein